jgi:hypothetical protein
LCRHPHPSTKTSEFNASAAKDADQQSSRCTFFSKGRARINDQARALSARARFISGARCPTIMKKATSKSKFACESAPLMLIDLRNSQPERLIVPVLLRGKGSRPFLFARCLMKNALAVRDALDTSEFD